jgi:ankyrin repeat protein
MMQRRRLLRAAISLTGLSVCLPITTRATDSSYEKYRFAIEMDQLRTFQGLVKSGLGTNLVMPDGSPALIYAMQRESRQIVEWLLGQASLQIDQKDSRGDSALMTACALGEQAWVETLIKRGAQTDPAGWTPLHYAAANGRLSIVQLLLKLPVNINAPSPNGTSPLMMAARSNSIEVGRLLIRKGALTEITNEAGVSALAYARRNQNEEFIGLLTATRAGKSN